MAKYKIKYKANDDVINTDGITTYDEFIKTSGITFYAEIKNYMKSMGYRIEGEVDYNILFTKHKPLEGDRFDGITVNFDEMWINLERMTKEEDAYYSIAYMTIPVELLEFFDRRGFEIYERATKDTHQEITDWYGKKDEL